MAQDKQELMDYILDHYEDPRNSGTITDADKVQNSVCQNGGNPGCGDIVTICLKVEDGIIKEFKFEGEGCIVSQAGTSIISELVVGKSLDEVTKMGPEVMTEILGEELTLSRPKCSTLGLSTVKLAITELNRQELKRANNLD
jgi:nitrogen fixation NifU-like protein